MYFVHAELQKLSLPNNFMSIPHHPLHCLVAAPHAPFHEDGSVNLAVIEKQAEHLLRSGVRCAFVNGSTGESSSLSVQERIDIAHRWSEVVRGTKLQLVVHVGANALEDARILARHGESIGASALSALAPSYYKPRSLGLLVDCCASIAEAAPQTPFYFYDIPSLTGVQFSSLAFLEQASLRIPTLVGIKFTNPDLSQYQMVLNAHEGRWDLPWGIDQAFLAALALGARGAIGSGYNFAAPVYKKLWEAFNRGDWSTAREAQLFGVRLVELLESFGYLAAAKATMGFLGVDVGPARLPNSNLSAEQKVALRNALESVNFFERVHTS
jgi:N-acetylneuraminate lyase